MNIIWTLKTITLNIYEYKQGGSVRKPERKAVSFLSAIRQWKREKVVSKCSLQVHALRDISKGQVHI